MRPYSGPTALAKATSRGTQAATMARMRMLIAMVMLSVGGLAAAADRPQLTGREAPRATDLLRAETLAEKARDRLRVPKHPSAGWQKGGDGWTARTRTPETNAVTIHVSPGGRRRTTP